MNSNRPFGLIYLMHLSPPSFLLQQDYAKPCLLQLFGSCNKLHIASTILGIFQCFPSSRNTLNTQNGCGQCLGTNLLSMGITTGEGRRRDYKDFSLRKSSSLSNKVGVLQKPLLGFFFFFSQQAPLSFLWLIKVYIVWVMGIRKVTILSKTGELHGSLATGASRKSKSQVTLLDRLY